MDHARIVCQERSLEVSTRAGFRDVAASYNETDPRHNDESEPDTLRAIDFYELGDGHLLREFVAVAKRAIACGEPLVTPEHVLDSPLFLDLGCGTGSATIDLINELFHDPEYPNTAWVRGVDQCVPMVDQARLNMLSVVATMDTRLAATFEVADVDAGIRSPPVVGSASGVMCTLTIAHLVSLAKFFQLCAHTLRIGGALLITSMHPDMAAEYGIGYHKVVAGVECRCLIRGSVYTVEEVESMARSTGFELVGGMMRERGVSPEMLRQSYMQDGTNARALGDRKVWMGGVWVKVCNCSDLAVPSLPEGGNRRDPDGEHGSAD